MIMGTCEIARTLSRSDLKAAILAVGCARSGAHCAPPAAVASVPLPPALRPLPARPARSHKPPHRHRPVRPAMPKELVVVHLPLRP